MSTPTITLVGNILRGKGDHDIIQYSTSKNGKPYCRFRVIASDRRKNDDGTWGYGDSCARDCIAFGPLAEHIAQTITEKCEVVIIGHERDKQWTDQQNIKHYSQEIVVDHLGLSLQWETYMKASQQQQSTGFVGNATVQQQQAPASDPWDNAGEWSDGDMGF